MVSVFLFGGITSSFAQKKTFKESVKEIFQDKSRHRYGFSVGYGFQDLGMIERHLPIGWQHSLAEKEVDLSKVLNLNVRYYYEVTLFQLEHAIALINKPTWKLELISIPQFNTVYLRPIDSEEVYKRGFEFGINTGLVIRKSFWKNRLGIYFLGSTGPHFVSDTPGRQHPGFIFSDNFMLGGTVKLFKGLHFDVRNGIRHISNLSIWQPNGGVNTFMMNAGFFYQLPAKP
ncbi:acyloxyacyl hydrolase [Pontibacter sp. G13]|uniref:acyloxyacyl hydrolase n=1 Tax=Pontibacter sp. G13 TaxID=3074898 RepID=UPI002889DD4A|nr:acyloxyacyl hydrolase [Pontibacter sp. G13]WNJ17995.1 acyloxyacyl hydrolase [Pontibacter sp. G13]